MRYVPTQVTDNTAVYYRVQDTGVDSGITFVGPPYGSFDEADAAAAALNA
jgi:hypothetical protein